MSTVVVFGGGGFLGRRLVDRLTAEGVTVRVAVRRPDQARFALRSIGFDRVMVVPADVRDRASVAAAVAGADAAINAVSTYVEQSGVTFEAVHVRGAENVAREAAAAGVARLVLVSGIGADPDSSSPYIRCSRTRRARGSAGVSGSYDRPSGRYVRSGRCSIQHARRAGEIPASTAANRRRPYPTAASLCRRCGGGYRQSTQRSRNCRPDLRACRSRRVHPARAGQHDATPHAQTAIAHTGPLCRGKDPGANVRAPAEPTTKHRTS